MHPGAQPPGQTAHGNMGTEPNASAVRVAIEAIAKKAASQMPTPALIRSAGASTRLTQIKNTCRPSYLVLTWTPAAAQLLISLEPLLASTGS